MPKDKGDIDLTEDEARANVVAHEKAHGHSMATPPGKGHHDTPTASDLDADPDWHKQGKGGPPGWHQVGDTYEED